MLSRADMEDALVKFDHRVRGVEQIVRLVAADVSAMKPNIVAVQTNVDTLSTQVSGVQRDLAELTHTVGTHHAETLERFHRMEGRFDRMDGRFDELLARFDQLAIRLDCRG